VEDDVEILTLPAARPEFINLSEAEVWKTVDEDPWQCNPVSGEVTRLVVQCKRKGKGAGGMTGVKTALCPRGASRVWDVAG
jgi:hypothetical protein